MIRKLNFFDKVCFSLLIFSLVIVLLEFSIVNFNLQFILDFSIYALMLLVPLVIIGVLFSRQIKKEGGIRTKLKIGLVWAALAIIFIITILPANHMSTDYETFLEIWTGYYRERSIKDAIYGIVDVSNYTPAYNYFLIIFSKLPFCDLYSIKYLTFIFSIYLSYIICKIVAHVSTNGESKKINKFLFLLVLVLPFVLMEYNAWGQCDAIYSSFALTAFYFALNKKSKLSFLFIGMSFAFKLQFLFIVPILFIMLIIKDKDGAHYLKWKDIYLAVIPFLINFIPLIVGRPFLDLIKVYISQSQFDDRISGMCMNVCFIFYCCGVNPTKLAYKIIIPFQIVLTLAILVLLIVLVLKSNKKRTFTSKDLLFWGEAFAFVMVFFMPKMLDRFYFIPLCLSLAMMFACKDKQSCLLGLLGIGFFSMSLILFMYKGQYLFVFNNLTHFSTAYMCYIVVMIGYTILLGFIGAVTYFVFLSKQIYSNYYKPLKNNNKI